jgi:hypothetical protein
LASTKQSLATTQAVGEEGGEEPVLRTMAVGEEGGFIDSILQGLNQQIQTNTFLIQNFFQFPGVDGRTDGITASEVQQVAMRDGTPSGVSQQDLQRFPLPPFMASSSAETNPKA